MKRTRLDQWICETEALPELTREGLDALQLRRLNAMLRRLRERGGIYRDYPGQLDALEDLKGLPFTTPEALGAHPGRYLITSQSEVQRVISGATSGTTGPAKRVFYTERDTGNTIGLFTAGIGEMLAPEEKCLICFPFSGPFGLGDLIAAAVEKLGGIPVKAGYGWTWGALCSLVRDTSPETFIGFPATLLGLARMYGEDFPIRRGLVSGDACPKGVTEALEGMLGTRLYPHYGSRECGLGGAVTCEAFEGMHLRENHIIPEIVDENGNVLPEGEWGELVITTIGMEAMPLIRYRTGDYTRILPPCPCGGVTRRLDRVSRREIRANLMERLDDALFRIPELVDFRAEYVDGIRIFGKTLRPGLEEVICECAGKICPQTEITVKTELCTEHDRPLYAGKRFVPGL